MSATGKKGTKRKVSHKTIDVKYEAILKVENGRSQSEIAQELGMSTRTLSTWVTNKKMIKKRFLEDGPKRKNHKSVIDDDVDLRDSRKPEENENEDQIVKPVKPPPTLDEALEAARGLVRYFMCQENAEELSMILRIETKLLNMKVKQILERKERELLTGTLAE